MTCRIWRVYMDRPDHVNPKEVRKVFRLMNERGALFKKLDGAVREKSKQHIQNEIDLHAKDIKMMMDLISPIECSCSIYEHTVDNKKFWVILITEPVRDELTQRGQYEEETIKNTSTASKVPGPT